LLLLVFHFFALLAKRLGRSSPKWPVLCRVGR